MPTTTPFSKPRVGRPRRGTEAARIELLIAAATRVFLRDGYGSASIDKVASEAGVSTRTIYERFKNKADLLGGVIGRLVERDVATILATDDLNRLDVSAALCTIGGIITARLNHPDSAALFRICATEAQRFPELAAKVRSSAKARIDDAVARYMRGQTECGALHLPDPDRAAVLFLQMLCADIHDHLLFGYGAPPDCSAHVAQVVELFLNGALPRESETT